MYYSAIDMMESLAHQILSRTQDANYGLVSGMPASMQQRFIRGNVIAIQNGCMKMIQLYLN